MVDFLEELATGPRQSKYETNRLNEWHYENPGSPHFETYYDLMVYLGKEDIYYELLSRGRFN